MKVVIVSYKAGNTASVRHALRRLGVEPLISQNAEDILAADKVIFPGVGEAASAMQQIRAAGLDQVIPELKQPVLGICLGMQLLCQKSEEGNTLGLGVFDTEVGKFSKADIIPHMGWNTVEKTKGPLFENISAGEHFYFVHSYYAQVCAQSAAQTSYEEVFDAALQKENFYGVQFHPEKSAKAGAQLLQNFLKL